jgi:hypothetical protein
VGRGGRRAYIYGDDAYETLYGEKKRERDEISRRAASRDGKNNLFNSIICLHKQVKIMVNIMIKIISMEK